MGPMAMGAMGANSGTHIPNLAPMGPSQPPWPSLLFLHYLTFALLISSLGYYNVLRGSHDVLRGLSLGKRALQKFKDSSLRSKGPIKRAEDPFSDSEVGVFSVSQSRGLLSRIPRTLSRALGPLVAQWTLRWPQGPIGSPESPPVMRLQVSVTLSEGPVLL